MMHGEANGNIYWKVVSKTKVCETDLREAGQEHVCSLEKELHIAYSMLLDMHPYMGKTSIGSNGC